MRRILLWVFTVLLVLFYFYAGLKFGNDFLKWVGFSTLDAKTIVEMLRSIIEVIAIIVAGVWTYERFIKNREDYPYPKIEQRCEHHVLDSNLIYLSVFVTVINQGKTKLDLDGAIIIVRQVSPLSREIKMLLSDALQNSGEQNIRYGKVDRLFVDHGQRLGWITLGQREWNEERGKINELEPGQTREFQFDFILPEGDVKVVEAISYFNNGKAAWELGTLYSLDTQNSRLSN